MQVKICSGNEAGAIKDLPQLEAEAAISTGYAELYDPAKDRAALDEKNATEKNAAKVAAKVKAKEARRLVKQSPSAKPAKKTAAKKATARKK